MKLWKREDHAMFSVRIVGDTLENLEYNNETWTKATSMRIEA